MTASIMPERLAEIDKSGDPVELIDVRTPAEFVELHVPFARNIPLDRLKPEVLVAQRNGRLSDPLYVICHSGSRGRQGTSASGAHPTDVSGSVISQA